MKPKLLSLLLLLFTLLACRPTPATPQPIIKQSPSPSSTNAIEIVTAVMQGTTIPTHPQQIAEPTYPPFEMELSLLPTLTTAARDELYFSLMEDNGGCELPCWWGIIPGETTWAEAAKLGSNFTDDIQTHPFRIAVERQGEKYFITLQTILLKFPESIVFKIGSEEIRLGHLDFQVRSDGVIEWIRPITRGSGDKYTIAGILTKMKQPSTLAVNITEIDLELSHYYTVNIYLNYAEVGVMAIYGNLVIADQQPLEAACFDGPADMYLWDPKDNFQIDELLPRNIADNLVDTQSAFGLSTEEFMRLVVEDGQKCFSIQVND